MSAGHLFPVPGVTALVTVTAVLRLVATAQLSLDTEVNEFLQQVRLENGAVTVRDLLSHASGVDSPAELYGDSVRAAGRSSISRCSVSSRNICSISTTLWRSVA